MSLLSRPRRPRRSNEWSAGKAVTFIVTLPATHNVTLAAREAGMSRKSAYALKERDPAFAFAWAAAVRVRKEPALSLSESQMTDGLHPKDKGDKVDEVHEPPVSPSHGDRRGRREWLNWARMRREHDAVLRDLFFASLTSTQAATKPPQAAPHQ